MLNNVEDISRRGIIDRLGCRVSVRSGLLIKAMRLLMAVAAASLDKWTWLDHQWWHHCWRARRGTQCREKASDNERTIACILNEREGTVHNLPQMRYDLLPVGILNCTPRFELLWFQPWRPNGFVMEGILPLLRWDSSVARAEIMTPTDPHRTTYINEAWAGRRKQNCQHCHAHLFHWCFRGPQTVIRTLNYLCREAWAMGWLWVTAFRMGS